MIYILYVIRSPHPGSAPVVGGPGQEPRQRVKNTWPVFLPKADHGVRPPHDRQVKEILKSRSRSAKPWIPSNTINTLGYLHSLFYKQFIVQLMTRNHNRGRRAEAENRWKKYPKYRVLFYDIQIIWQPLDFNIQYYLAGLKKITIYIF